MPWESGKLQGVLRLEKQAVPQLQFVSQQPAKDRIAVMPSFLQP